MAILRVKQPDGTWVDVPAIKGDPGYTPRKGVDYFDGKDGQDGYTPVKGVDYFDGVDGKDGSNGKDGADGYTPQKGVDYRDGVDGKDGTSVTVASVSESSADGGNNVVTFSDGKTVTIKNGSKGSDGYTPQKNVDYFDGKDGKDGAAGKDGQDGYTPVKGVDYFDGKDGQNGSNGSNGVSATHSWNGTVLTVTSASGTSSSDLKGEKGDPYTLNDTDKNAIAAAVKASLPTETWTFTLEDGSTVTKAVYIG